MNKPRNRTIYDINILSSEQFCFETAQIVLLSVEHVRTIQIYTVELKWLEHLWDHENMLETGVVRANEC